MAAWSVDACRTDPLSDEVAASAPRANGSRVLRLDLDRDGNADFLEARLDGPERSIVARLSRHGPRRVRLAWEVPAGALHGVVAAPADAAEDRALLEHLAFPRVCDAPDAALSAVLQGDAAPWVEGPPVEPVDYAWADGDRWVWFGGAALAGPLTEVARDGESSLRTSPRAAVLVRPDAHRWVHVEPGEGRVRTARFAAPDAVEVEVEPAPGAAPRVVRHAF